MPGAPLLAFTRASAFLRFLRSTTASMDGPIAVWLSTSVLAARASGSWAAALPALPPRPLMAVDFAAVSLLVRPGRPRYPVLVHQAAALLHASFRPHLAVGSACAELALAFR